MLPNFGISRECTLWIAVTNYVQPCKGLGQDGLWVFFSDGGFHHLPLLNVQLQLYWELIFFFLEANSACDDSMCVAGDGCWKTRNQVQKCKRQWCLLPSCPVVQWSAGSKMHILYSNNALTSQLGKTKPLSVCVFESSGMNTQQKRKAILSFLLFPFQSLTPMPSWSCSPCASILNVWKQTLRNLREWEMLEEILPGNIPGGEVLKHPSLFHLSTLGFCPWK